MNINKYLGVQLDGWLSFVEHLQIASAKAIQCEPNLAGLILKIGGPREAKKRLVTIVVHSKLLYAALVWACALYNHDISKKLYCFDQCCIGPGKRAANRLISEAEVGGLSAP